MYYIKKKMCRKIVLFFCLVFFISIQLKAEVGTCFKYNGYLGGMMIHSGYLASDEFDIFDSNNQIVGRKKIEACPVGIGGVFKVFIAENFRIGFDGGITMLKLDDYGSSSSIGFGGILVGANLNIKNFLPFFETAFHFGTLKNIILLESSKDDFIVEKNVLIKNTHYHSLVPSIGLEYGVSKKIRLLLKSDYIIPLSKKDADFVTGVRIYLGVLFTHLK